MEKNSSAVTNIFQLHENSIKLRMFENVATIISKTSRVQNFIVSVIAFRVEIKIYWRAIFF